MKARTAAWLAWTLTALILAMFVAYLALALSRPDRVPRGIPDFDLQYVVSNLPFLVFAGVGGLIAARRPKSPVGWLFLAIGFCFLFPLFGTDYTLRASHPAPGSLPAAGLVSWPVTWTWFVGIGTIALAILLFPNGELLNRRWRPVVWLVAVDTAFASLAIGAFLWPYRGLRLVAGWDQNESISLRALSVLNIAFPILLVGILAAALSLVLRFRRARGEERQQLKWVAYGAGLLAGTALIGYVTGFDDDSPLLVAVDVIGTLAIPVTIGVAILKYRLYDIDLIINRTLVYGALTALLAAIYALLVVVIPRALRVGGDSELVVAGSTLAVAALFQPLRRRIQAFIDRRFYRRKYDASRTVEAFSSRLRNEVDLEAMRTDLLAAAQETMQPRQASVWLRPS